MAAAAEAQAAPAPVGDEFVSFDNVQKTYDGDTLVIQDLNLKIRQGEFLSLLGPSGSGKTTTLLMLAGFERPTSGEIYMEGEPLSRTPPHHREFGMVFQDYALFPNMTVFENVAFPLTIRRMGREELRKQVNEALEMVELSAFGERPTSLLSGGQQQRVALARALVYRPRLVLMDEPLGALDKQLREQMQLEIKHIQQSLGITVVYVTHDQQEALVMSDRIAVFSGGRIHQLDTPGELYEHPTNAFVAQFIGENNQVSGTVTSIKGNRCVVTLEDGTKIRAKPVNVSAVGEATMMSIRPERVTINATKRLDNNVQGTVEEIIYYGDATRIRLSIPGGGNDFVVKLPIESLHAELKPGDQAKLGWLEENCLALDAQKTSGAA